MGDPGPARKRRRRTRRRGSDTKRLPQRLASTSDETLIASTAGFCFDSPGPGGWAWATEHNDQYSGPARRTTAERMEFVALRELLGFVSEEVELQIQTSNYFVVRLFGTRKLRPTEDLDLIGALREVLKPRIVHFSPVVDEVGRSLHDQAHQAARNEATRTGGTS